MLLQSSEQQQQQQQQQKKKKSSNDYRETVSLVKLPVGAPAGTPGEER